MRGKQTLDRTDDAQANISPAMARVTAELLSPAAQKSSSEANSPWAYFFRYGHPLPCIGGPRRSFPHAMRARKAGGRERPEIFAASTSYAQTESAALRFARICGGRGPRQVDCLRLR